MSWRRKQGRHEQPVIKPCKHCQGTGQTTMKNVFCQACKGTGSARTMYFRPGKRRWMS